MDDVRFVDIHCHLAPGIDDGSKSWRETLQMAEMAAADGFTGIICTPHQLGSFAHNTGERIRSLVDEVQRFLQRRKIPLQVVAGADVRIEPPMSAGLKSGEIVSLGDHRKHVLLELPHEMYLPLEPVLEQLEKQNLVGVLSHPERNRGLLRKPSLLRPLVERGCLMQVTAGSLLGTFGEPSRRLAETMLEQGLVHFLATDAHGPRSRRPLMRRAYERVVEMIDETTARALCCENPLAVFEGHAVEGGVQRLSRRRGLLSRLFSWTGDAA